MLKLILNIIRLACAICAFAYFMINATFLVQNKLQDEAFPTLFNYSFLKYKNDSLEPDIKKDSYLFFQIHQKLNENDIIAYDSNLELKVKKIVSINDDRILVTNSKNDYEEIKSSQVYGKLIYHNDKLSEILSILFTPLAFMIMIVLIVFIPKITFRKY